MSIRGTRRSRSSRSTFRTRQIIPSFPRPYSVRARSTDRELCIGSRRCNIPHDQRSDTMPRTRAFARPALGAFIIAVVATSLPAQEATPAYKNEALPFEVRVKDLIGRMTLEEKVSQMKDVAPAIPRLDVPEYNWWNEALHGVARSGLATVFPQAIGLAATWDTALMGRIA